MNGPLKKCRSAHAWQAALHKIGLTCERDLHLRVFITKAHLIKVLVLGLPQHGLAAGVETVSRDLGSAGIG